MKDYVEVFGLPACGKTSYLSNNNIFNMNKKFLSHPSRFVRFVKKIFLYFNFLILYPSLFFKVNRIFKKIKFTKSILKIKMYVYLCNILYLVMKSKKYSTCTCYFDEGLLQVLWSICYNSEYEDDFIDFYLIEFKDLFSKKVIFIDTDLELNFNRLINRNSNGGSELEHDVKNGYSYFARAIKIRDDILKRCKDEFIDIECIKEGF